MWIIHKTSNDFLCFPITWVIDVNCYQKKTLKHLSIRNIENKIYKQFCSSQLYLDLVHPKFVAFTCFHFNQLSIQSLVQNNNIVPQIQNVAI